MVGTESGGQWSREKKTDAAATVEPTIPVAGDSTFQSNRRPRSLSVASAQPSVETVVTKAKRAASTLWTLLHAQHCPLADTCAHPGCKEAKLLHLHFKMCAAAGDFACPTKHYGCEQGRKLLAHYKRCRSIRARQVGLTGARRDASQHHVCLVCNLVARQARSTLERPKIGSSTSATATVRKSGSRKVISSFMLDSSNRVVEVGSPKLMPPPKMMPPPPPRLLGMAAAGQQRDVWSSQQTKRVEGMTSRDAPAEPRMLKTDSGTEDGKPVSYARDRSYSQVELVQPSAHSHRPRSLSLGTALSAAGSTASSNCDTIIEEGEGELVDYTQWGPNPAV